MNKLNGLESQRVFHYFEEICNIPHGSGNMDKISNYCANFAEKHNLEYVRDEANNVIIYKKGTQGYEKSAPIIMQGHLDMVCQKTPASDIDFEADGLEIYIDDDFIKAKRTTLGADNGIAVAMMLSILESDKISHPPIEAVFTTDEEIGMIGAGKLDMSKLTGKRMINLDMGKNDEAIVSCAGGVDVKASLPINRVNTCGKRLSLVIEGLKGGHSGEMIDKGRVNANVLAGRLMFYADKFADFDVIAVNGGDKGNVIPSRCEISLVVKSTEDFIPKMEDYFEIIKNEVKDREENLKITIHSEEEGNFKALGKDEKNKLICLLMSVPNGVIEMSTKIQNLVETSLNLGVLESHDDKIYMQYVLRSNKESSLEMLQEKVFFLCQHEGCNVEASGFYPPWEYIENTQLQEQYKKCFKEKFKKDAKLYAIHAGLECGIFSAKIKDLDCIAIGPDMYDIHTVNERLSISATNMFYDFLIYFLAQCK